MTTRNALGIEQSGILTISTAHLSRETLAGITVARGDLSEGPSIAVREEGFLVNSYLGSDDALEQAFRPGVFKPMAERFPDLVLIQALARGLKAEWINIDRDGVEYSDILPSYDDDGVASQPTADGWRDALGEIGTNFWGGPAVVPSREVLEIIEAGQTPRLYDDSPDP